MNRMQDNYSKFDASNFLRTFFLTAFKHKKIIVWTFGLVMAAGLAATFLMPPTFEASSTLLLERENDTDKALLFRMNFQNRFESYDWLKAELEIVRSYPVALAITEKLAGKSEADATRADDYRRVQDFLKGLEVKNPNNSNLIEVSYRAANAELAAYIVNQVVETYKSYRSKIFSDSEAYSFLEQQIGFTNEKLRRLEEALTDYKSDQEILSPVTQGEMLLKKLAEYESRLTEVNTKRIANEAKVAVIKEQLRNGSQNNIPSTEVSEGPSRRDHIAKLKGELLDKTLDREKLLQRFNPSYEKVINLEKEIATLQGQVRNEIQQIIEQEETALRALRAEERALQRSIDEINAEVRAFARKEFEFSQLNRGIDDNREVYSVLLKQREEARISLSKLQRDIKIKVINPAVAPPHPLMPGKLVFLTVTFALALLLALGFAFLREYLDNTICTTEQLRNNLGLKVLGAVNTHNNLGKYLG